MALLVALLAGPVPTAGAVTGPGSAVVLVSGFDTVTPFSTSDPSCAGKEGAEWNPPTGPATALKGAGYTVFTAPVKQAGKPAATPCAPGTPVPPLSAYVNSNGDTTTNGQAIGGFLAFLKANYGVTKVDIVAHSDGGLWSRSAITQQSAYPGVTVYSYTSLGTPQTGSFVADLAEDIVNGKCTSTNPIARAVCRTFQDLVQKVVTDLGEQTVEQLSSDYLRTWNPEQKMGACPASGIAGTYIDLPLPPSILPGYYNPNDGLVGEASALGQASRTIGGDRIPAAGIPGFADAGTYPVVHGTSFAFLDPNNLLNQPQISARVVSVMQAQAAAPTCTTPAPNPPTPTPDGKAKVTIPLHGYAVPVRGLLPRTKKGDVVLLGKKVSLRCKKRRIRSTPFPRNPRLSIAVPRCKQPMTVRGKGKALLIRVRGTATVEINGKSVSVRVHKVGVRAVRLSYEQGSRYVPVELSRSAEGSLPAGTGPITLRVVVKARKKLRPLKGRKLEGSATVSR